MPDQDTMILIVLNYGGPIKFGCTRIVFKLLLYVF
jgi:hypothetical protein